VFSVPAIMDAGEQNAARARAAQMQQQDSQMEQQKEQQEKAVAMEEQRRVVLRQILTPEASERLSRIGLVRQEKQRAIEDMLLQAMQRGGLGGKVDESTIIDLLGKYEAAQQKSQQVQVQRKTIFDDEDDFDFDNL
jgi:DNA-binding TFAR19-related protein (PDSD5 family)